MLDDFIKVNKLLKLKILCQTFFYHNLTLIEIHGDIYVFPYEDSKMHGVSEDSDMFNF